MATATILPGDICTTVTYNSSADCWQEYSCRQCLEISGCMINVAGVCMGIASDSMREEHRYTNAIAQNLTIPLAPNDPRINDTQEWVFEASRVKYCPDDDTVCKKCIANNFYSAQHDYFRDSRFCIGAGDCVCVSNCYKPESICDIVYRQKMANQTTSPPSSSLAPKATYSDSLPTDDDCRYSTSSNGCRTYRPCHECLTKKGCRISESGYCERDPRNASTSGNAFDYRLATTKNLTLPAAYDRNASALKERQVWRFPAFAVSYCPVDDSVCKRCTQEKFWMPSGESPDSRYCIGANNCVCIANCAQPDTQSTCSLQADQQVQNASNKTSGLHGWSLAGVVVGAAAVLTVIAFVVAKRRSPAVPSRVQETMPLAPSAPAASPCEGIHDEYSFYSDGTNANACQVPSAPPTPAANNPQASAPALELQPASPKASAPMALCSSPSKSHRVSL